MQIRILAFAGLRELLGASERSLDLPDGARIEDAWSAISREHPTLSQHRAATRVARNGRLGAFDDALADGDELALLPPVGGG
ncbi:MAG: MoaD/ThiS family protein [Candidatus Cybelea sp.]